MVNLRSSSYSHGASYFVGRTEELSRIQQIYKNQARERIAVIVGPAGIGKSALARQFANMNDVKVHVINTNIAKTIEDMQILFVGMAVPQRDEVLIFNDIGHFLEPEKAIDYIQKYSGDAMVIATSNREIKGISNIILQPLTASEISTIWASNLFNIDPDSTDAKILYQASNGSPLMGTLLGRLVRDDLVKVEDIQNYFKSFHSSGLVDPTGKPISSSDDVSDILKDDICAVDSQLLYSLRTNPEILYQLSPRKFEELVADILTKLGYSTQLTQATRDGGKDIYAARKDSVGSFLYIVECKRYAPDNHVGVGVIRQLYGVVQAERANGGIVATTSYFSKDAKDFQENINYQLSLRDYFDLQRLISEALSVKTK